MQDLAQRLSDSERMKTELLRVNGELRKMLENLEVKGSQIAKLAKEKVLKYRDENDAMQLELNTLKEAGTAPGTSGESEPGAACSKTVIDSSAGDELWCKIKEIQEQISTALKGLDPSQNEGLRQTVTNASNANEALRVSMEEARVKTGGDLSALSIENDQLRSLIDDFDNTRKRMEKTEAKNRDLLAEQISSLTAKDKEISELKEELNRLKGAIGQLIGSK
jgi:regulator of replication initiation timing